MLFFHGSEQAPRLFLAMCVWGFFLQPAEQFPVGEGFNLLLYPLSVMGPYGSHTVLIPATGTEQNTQRSQTPQANSSKISAHSESKPLHANSGFLQPDPAPDSAPSPTHLPSESLPLQGQFQMSHFVPSNVPLQSDSGSSEEEAAAQVIYMVPISVGSPSMGVMEGTGPNPGPGPLQFMGSTTPAAAQLDARGQRAQTETLAPGVL
ncbi:uncharacterized protein LOC113041691 isoform X1 [Carassius auratus]|uniref:Uncharacterized protein LOC113041691 isoform X1 n=1 Tax=Carassius auratus TaxID=7957 RepID=A0A6P6J772_CARAU|nr:uncharacterized protein LOC113041691 isoform X1 [Carassius auratus]